MFALTIVVPIGIILLAVLILPTRNVLTLRIRSGFSVLKINIGFMAGLIPIKLHFIIMYKRGEGLYVARVHRDNSQSKVVKINRIKRRKPKQNKAGLTSLFWTLHKKIRVVSFIVSGYIGTYSPYSSVMLCGIFNALISSAVKVLCVPPKHKDVFTSVNLRPRFEERCFILNLEGIFYSSPTEIIIVILKERLKKQKAG